MHTDTGILGGAVKDVLFGLLGLFAYLAPFMFVAAGILAIAARKKKVNKRQDMANCISYSVNHVSDSNISA